MLDDEASLNFWVSEHERLYVRIRRALLVLVALTTVAGIDAFAEIQHRQERYLYARKFAHQLAATGVSPGVAGPLHFTRCVAEPDQAGCPDGRILARIEDIPGINLDYELYLVENHPDRKLSVFEYEVPLTGFALALAFGPLLLLIHIYFQVRAMSVVGFKLRSWESLEVRRRTNSIFSARSATLPGKNRYAALWTLILWVLAIAPQALLLIVRAQMRSNSSVLIDLQGSITVLEPADRILFARLTDGLLLEFAIYSGVALVIALLAGLSARRQLAGFPVSNRYA